MLDENKILSILREHPSWGTRTRDVVRGLGMEDTRSNYCRVGRCLIEMSRKGLVTVERGPKDKPKRFYPNDLNAIKNNLKSENKGGILDGKK